MGWIWRHGTAGGTSQHTQNHKLILREPEVPSYIVIYPKFSSNALE